MSDKQYSNKIKNACVALKISTCKLLHFGRKVSAVALDMEEVDEGSKRAIGNWSTDVFGTTYSSQVPLAAMRTLSGSDKRRGFYENSRTTFINEEKYGSLARFIFPWIEHITAKCNLKDRPTARAFLNMLRNMRWVILQDAAVMLSVDKRQHVLFEIFPVFKMLLFHEFQIDLLHHMRVKDASETDATKIDNILPGVRHRMDLQIDGQDKVYNTLKLIHDESREYQKNMTMEKITTTIESTVGGHIAHFSGYMGQYVPPCNPLLQQQETHGTHEPIQIHQADVEMVPTNNSTALVLTQGDVVTMPDKFESMYCLMHYWNSVSDWEDKGKEWRKSFSNSDKKRFTRCKRVVQAINSKVDSGCDRETIMDQFEDVFIKNKKSFYFMAEKYLKEQN